MVGRSPPPVPSSVFIDGDVADDGDDNDDRGVGAAVLLLIFCPIIVTNCHFVVVLIIL